MIRKITGNKQAIIGLVMIGIVVCVALLAPLLAPNDPEAINPIYKFAKADAMFPLGADQLGRCILSRMLYGARYSLGLAVPMLVLLACISMIVGTLSAYIGGRFDRFITVISDIFMAFPPLVFVLSLVGALGQGIMNLMIAIICSMWVWFAKLIRSYVLIEKKKGYMMASRIIGCSDYTIIIKHILPNILPSLIVYFSTSIAFMILMISGFSFLGLGIAEGTPEWGAMLSAGKAYLYHKPHILIYPGVCILFTAAGFNLFGEALRDMITPKER